MNQATLCQRFVGLFPTSLSSRITEAVFHDLHDAWSEPRRVYHGIEHLQACLRTIDEFPIDYGESLNAEIAIWWHDAIHVPGDGANEEKSAYWFGRVARVLGIHPPGRIQESILATRHGPEPMPNTLASYVCDVDLAILGRNSATYDAYAEQIRREYEHVPDGPYRVGRARVLRGFLAKPHLYHREDFRTRFEAPARENLLREVTYLETPS